MRSLVSIQEVWRERKPVAVCQVTTGRTSTTWHDMSLPPDQPPSPKPKLSSEERRVRQADRLKTIRLRMAIFRALDEREITDPRAIGEALGMPTQEANGLLTRHRWREGDVARLGVRVSRSACTAR